jgi:cytochrome c oxidase cbb3-type subunit 4
MNYIDLYVKIHSFYTILMLSSFIVICIWAWSGRQRRRFEEAANLPFADEEQERATVASYARHEETDHE